MRLWPFSRKDADANGNRFYREYIVEREIAASERHLKVTAALAAGLRIAEGVASLPISYGKISHDALGRAVRLPVMEGDLIERLTIDPNDYMTPCEFVENITLHAVFEGVGRAYIDRGYRGKIKRFIPCNDGMTVTRDQETGRVSYAGVIPGIGHMEDMTRKDFIEITSPRWEDTEGLDVSAEIRNVLKLGLALEGRQLEDSLKQAVRGYLSSAETLGDDVVDRIVADLKDKLPGTPIFDQGVQYKTLQQTQAELQMMDTRRFVIEEVARAYGIHPIFLAHDAAGQSLTRIKDAMDYHVTVTLGPWVTRWEQAIRFALLKPDEYVDLDEMEYYRMDLAAKADYASKALGNNAAWETPNSILEMFGKNPVEGGDALPSLGGRSAGGNPDA